MRSFRPGEELVIGRGRQDVGVVMMHDRDMEGRIVAERRRASDNSTDQFMSTYAHGVLGLISRTAEKENVSTADNVEYWYLGDAMGNHAGVLDNTGSAQFREYDAFGVHRGTLILAGSGYYRVLPGPYMWRGGEGSETDVYTDQDSPPESPINSLSTGFVHMGYRYYEPQTGRFTQRDPVNGGNPLTLNPYAYVENDPVNMTDPLGLTGWLGVFGALVAFFGGAMGGYWGNVIGGAGVICFLMDVLIDWYGLEALLSLLASDALIIPLFLLALTYLATAALIAAPAFFYALYYSIQSTLVMFELETGSNVSPFVRAGPGDRDSWKRGDAAPISMIAETLHHSFDHASVERICPYEHSILFRQVRFSSRGGANDT